MGFENGHLVRVVLEAVGPGTLTQVNVLHYDLDNGGLLEAGNDPQQLADDFRDDVVPAYAALFRNTWTVQPVIVEDERDPLHPTDPRQAWTSGSAVVGTRTGTSDVMPPGITGINTWLTGHIGRRFRGRMFIAGSILEDDQNAGLVGSSILVPWQTFIDAIPKEPDLAGGASEARARLCVYSRTQRAANLDPYASAVTGNILRNKLHYLRSRAQ
jgi:hypothetical protein